MSDKTKKIDDAELVEITGGQGIVDLNQGGIDPVKAGTDDQTISDRSDNGGVGNTGTSTDGNNDGMQNL